MSSLLGHPEEPWPLARAVDALTDSARRAGVPGLVWLAGLCYPSLSISLDLAQSLLGTIEELAGVSVPGGAVGIGPLLSAMGPSTPTLDDESILLWGPLILVPLLFFYRLVAGLARLSDPVAWDREKRAHPGLAVVKVTVGEAVDVNTWQEHTVGLREVWRAGKGLGASAMGLWLVLLGLLGAATVILLGVPIGVVYLVGWGAALPLFVGLLLPVILLLLAYATVLQVVNQLALHSLSHNRRGVASALAHAWRLMRQAPRSVARAAALELILFGTVVLLGRALHALFGTIPPLGWLGLSALYGFAGVTRAGFWARAYRDLGGLSSADRVPGLA